MDVEWFKAQKRDLKITDAALAEALGVERSVANKVVNGRVAFNARRADPVARLFQTSRDEVLFRAGVATEPPTSRSEVVDPDHLDLVAIQQIDLSFGMGATFTDSPVEVEVLHFPKVWVEAITSSPPALLTWARGRGDSMVPTINDGDLVLLDRSQRRVVEQDAIWAYTIGDMGSIKRLRVKGDRFQILSDNATVPLDEEPIDFVNIVARVIFIGKRS